LADEATKMILAITASRRGVAQREERLLGLRDFPDRREDLIQELRAVHARVEAPEFVASPRH
jgi:hypothetical protein